MSEALTLETQSPPSSPDAPVQKPQELFSLASPLALDNQQFPLLKKEGEDATNLAEGTLNLIKLCTERNIDTLFFLDKSARPAAFLFRHTWENLILII